MNWTKFLLAGATAVALAMPARSATIDIIGGSAGTVRSAAGNDALGPLGLGRVLAGIYGGTVVLTGAADVTFTLLGFEAGYRNRLFTDTMSLVGGGGRRFARDGIAAFTLAGVGPGVLDFGFRTSGGNLSVLNGANPDNSGPNRSPGVNFFAALAGDGSLLLFFDDDGANNDDDHDDLVVRVDVAPVPLPAAGLMLAGALGGIVLLRRRRV